MKRTPLFLLIPVLALAGCELLVDFDRTKIPSDAVDGSVIVPVVDGSVDQPDATTDAGTEDAATEEDAGDTDGGDTDGGITDGGDTDGGDTDAGEDEDAGDAG